MNLQVSIFFLTIALCLKHIANCGISVANSADPKTSGNANASNIYQMILSSKDRAFHFELYEWFINKGMIKQLLTVSHHLSG
jgi:hypothetical protein